MKAILRHYAHDVVQARFKKGSRAMPLPGHNLPLISRQLYGGYKTRVACLYMTVLPNWISGRIYVYITLVNKKRT